MKTFFGLTLLLLLVIGLHAQDKPRFSSQNYVGILEGESGTALQMQTINGFRAGNWFAGIGTGLDYYSIRSIPLFVSVNRFLGNAKLPLYFNADVGINFPWRNNNQYWIHNPGELSPSLYWAGGMGYRFGLKGSRHALLLNMGYAYKRLIEESNFVNPCLVPPCPVSTERYDYRLKRLSVKLGFMF